MSTKGVRNGIREGTLNLYKTMCYSISELREFDSKADRYGSFCNEYLALRFAVAVS